MSSASLRVGTRVEAILATALLMSACGFGGGATASHSPSPSAAASPSPTPTPSTGPQPVTQPYGVLVGSQAATTYTVSLIGVDGKVAASAETGTPTLTTCGNVAAA